MNWQRRWLMAPRQTWVGLAAVSCVFALLTAALAPVENQAHLSTIVLAYLLVTLLASAIWGYRVGIISAVIADLVVNFFFVEPLHQFAVQQTQNVAALVVYLAVALIGASMLALLRRQAMLAEARSVEATLLLDLTRAVAHATTPRLAMQSLCTAMTRALSVRGCAILREDSGDWRAIAGTGSLELSRDDCSMAAEALRKGEIVRLRPASVRKHRTGTERAESLVFVPFQRATRVAGALRLSGEPAVPAFVDIARLLEAFADEAASTVERARLAEDADRSEALRRADELKTTILSSVSHDLRSPLTAIKAATGTLRDDAGDWNGEDRESLLATIESQTDALATTVNNLLAMSRLEAGAVTPLLEAIEVQPLLSEVLLNAAADLGDHPVTVNARPGLWVLADYGLLSQALKNLVQNAAKYSTSKGEVVLSAIPAGERMRICVSDGGPGIPPEDLLHVFEKFYRGHNTARTSGTGLGLSITRAIVNLCGGRISVTSGQTGTTFMIDLRMTVEPGH